MAADAARKRGQIRRLVQHVVHARIPATCPLRRVGVGGQGNDGHAPGDGRELLADLRQRLFSRGESDVQALRAVGVPYTDEQIKGAYDVIKDKTELDALIAYLQGMGLALK